MSEIEWERERETGKWLTNKEYVKLMAKQPTSDTSKKTKRQNIEQSIKVFVVVGINVVYKGKTITGKSNKTSNEHNWKAENAAENEVGFDSLFDDRFSTPKNVREKTSDFP